MRPGGGGGVESSGRSRMCPPLKLNADGEKKVQKKKNFNKTQEKKQKTTENYQLCKFDGNKNGGKKKKKKCWVGMIFLGISCYTWGQDLTQTRSRLSMSSISFSL